MEIVYWILAGIVAVFMIKLVANVFAEEIWRVKKRNDEKDSIT